jgi:hypothetical protein
MAFFEVFWIFFTLGGLTNRKIIVPYRVRRYRCSSILISKKYVLHEGIRRIRSGMKIRSWKSLNSVGDIRHLIAYNAKRSQYFNSVK